MSQDRKDPTRILRDEHDSEVRAKKVKIVGTEMSIELNHADGDSVTTHPAKLVVKAEGVEKSDNDKEIIPALDCSSLSEVRVDVNGSGQIDILVSPEDSGDFFYKVGQKSQTIAICARRIKVVSVNAIGDVHLVGRS